MRVISYERRTGMGAYHATEVQVDGKWWAVSQVPPARKVNRDNGFDVWEGEVPEGTPIREYHRSNSGAVQIVAGRMLDGARYRP